MHKFLSHCYQFALLLYNTWFNKIPNAAFRRTCIRALGGAIPHESVVFRRVDLIKPLGLKIGKHSSVGWFTLLDARGGITIGDNVTVASYCKIVTAKHDIEDSLFKASVDPVVIEDYAWICTGAIILGGVTIGRGAVVAAGAVVTKDVPPMTVVGGIPARKIGDRHTEPIFVDDMKWVFLN